MADTHKNSWINSALLLGALVAGMFTTQFVPAYQEHVGKITYPSRAAATSDAPNDTSPGHTQAQHHDRHIALFSHVE